MTLYNLMHDTQPAKPRDVQSLRWKPGRGLFGWFERLLERTGEHADYHRKV